MSLLIIIDSSKTSVLLSIVMFSQGVPKAASLIFLCNSHVSVIHFLQLFYKKKNKNNQKFFN